MRNLSQVIFEAAIERNRSRIDNMPNGPERDAYIEGMADVADAFVWETL
jgi:hypothetical protein